MAVKVTFTLDETTIARLNETAQRLSKPKSEVVREAIQSYHAKSDRLSETERLRMVRVMKEILAKPPTRSRAEVQKELRELRLARRSGGRLHPAE
ncbi:MAG TPA: ribbon-helix-helix protein, CopG family [Bryobacteraceae bacterium]|nr:ribbon-helix-helix protein, CopG family [Bryobacteraceae bacterium]